MFTTTQQLADAKANFKIFLSLALLGALAGAVAGTAIHYRATPESPRQVISPDYIIKFNLARLPPPLASQDWLARRHSAHTAMPLLAEHLDAYPAAATKGAGRGALALPLSISSLLALARRQRQKTATRRPSPLDAYRR